MSAPLYDENYRTSQHEPGPDERSRPMGPYAITSEHDGKPDTLAGDWRDDDSQTLDALVTTQPDGINTHDQVHGPGTTVNTTPRTQPRRLNRMLTGAQQFPAGSTPPPVSVLPADPLRTTLTVRVIGAATDAVMVADDPAKLFAGGSYSGAMMIAGGGAFTPDSFTGPVWVLPVPTNAGNVWFTWGGVTE